MCDSLHGQFHPHGLLAAMHLKNQTKVCDKKKDILPERQPEQQPKQAIPRQTPRLSLAQVKKAAAYPSAAAARSSLRRPSVTSAPEISQTTEESPTGDAPCPPPLLRHP